MNWIPLLGKEKTFDAAAAWFFSLDVDGSRVTNTNGKIMFQTLSLLSEVHNNFLGKRCEGGQLDYSHRFRAESMSILVSIFSQSKTEEVSGWLFGWEASDWWCGGLTSPPLDTVCRSAGKIKHFLFHCRRQVLWEKSMIKLRSYLNLWSVRESLEREKERGKGRYP